jgi:crotonobetainyl-CoA:carnitine CoA-transferase CaiB-like acyl-CoA transferase
VAVADRAAGPPRALEGLRVLDLSILFSAPQVAAILGDLGADVVKLEPPARDGKRGGDPMRGMGAQRGGRSLMWAMVSRNKRTVTCDPTVPSGRDLLRRLVAAADVVVENLPAATLAKWGATPDELLAVNPDAIVVSVSCYGSTGPYAGRDGNGSLAEAFGGLTNLIGLPDGPPMLPSVALGDTLTAIAGVVGALAACYHRDARGGRGQKVDVSMYEPVLQLLGGAIVAHRDGEPPPHRTGSRVPNGVPRNVYRTGDEQWLVVSGTTDHQVARLLPILGLDTDDGRARFGTVAARAAHGDELDALVADWIAAHERDLVIETFLDARIPVAPVNTVADIVADPHVRARDDLVTVDDPEYGPVRMLAPLARLSATPATVRWAGPALGAHTDDVYREWLALADDELDGLRREGVI